MDHVFEVNMGNHTSTMVYTAVYTAVLITYSCTASAGNDGAGAVDCDSHRAVGPVRNIRGVF